MLLDVTPGALAAASAQVASITSQLMASNAIHAATTAAIMPPGSDIPSIKTAMALIGKGVTHEAAAAMGNFELASSSMGVAESGVSYQIGEEQGTAIYAAAGGI